MSGNGDSSEAAGGRSDSSPSTCERTAKRQKAIRFPGRHANGAASVYKKDLFYRDNSSYLETLFNHQDNALCFTRPMQLGKSVLFSLANEMYSKSETSNVDSDNLGYSPGEDDRNKWFVLRVNFGAVRRLSHEEQDWEQECRALDQETEKEIKFSVVALLRKSGSEELCNEFQLFSNLQRVHELDIGTLISALTRAVENVRDGRLLILVDEYDQPIREGLLTLIPKHHAGLYANVKAKMKGCYRNYFVFFGAVKVALDRVGCGKIWLTGILPIGIKEMSGLNVKNITFDHEMANAVGLTDGHVQQMLNQVDKTTPFRDDEERNQVRDRLRQLFNNLGFPGGDSLYHTSMINGMMNSFLKESETRREFLQFGRVPKNMSVEPVSSAIFEVLCNARNLRHVVNKLLAGHQLQGYNLNKNMSLEDLLKDTIDIGDYLTLLVHVGVATVTTDATDSEVATFHLTSGFYRDNLLEPIVKTLKASLEKLVSYTSTHELYSHGEDILEDFVTSISKNGMAELMAWASSDVDNHILELQFQGHVVTQAHRILNGIAHTTQEDRLPETGKRTDVTFSSATSVVVLELKQVPSEAAPPEAFIANAHEQLAGYVETRRLMEAAGRKARAVAGFVVIMYNDGASYIVEKLRGDNPTQRAL